MALRSDLVNRYESDRLRRETVKGVRGQLQPSCENGLWRAGQGGNPSIQVLVEGVAAGQTLKGDGTDHISLVEGDKESPPAANPAAAGGTPTAWADGSSPPEPTSTSHLPGMSNGTGPAKGNAVRAQTGYDFGTGGVAGTDELSLGGLHLLAILRDARVDRDGNDTDAAAADEGRGTSQEKGEGTWDRDVERIQWAQATAATVGATPGSPSPAPPASPGSSVAAVSATREELLGSSRMQPTCALAPQTEPISVAALSRPPARFG